MSHLEHDNASLTQPGRISSEVRSAGTSIVPVAVVGVLTFIAVVLLGVIVGSTSSIFFGDDGV